MFTALNRLQGTSYAGRVLRAAGADLLAKVAARMPVERLLSRAGVSLVAPYYHIVSDNWTPHVSHLYRFRSVREFTADVEFFLRHFEPVSLADIVAMLDGRRRLAPQCFHLTFDDGLREVYDVVAPILERAGAPATFFLNTAFLDGGGMAHHNAISIVLDRMRDKPVSKNVMGEVERIIPSRNKTTLPARLLALPYRDRALVEEIAVILGVDLPGYVRTFLPYLSSDQVRSLLGRGFQIGAHSHDHPLYADLPLEGQVEQTRKSVQILDQKFGLSPKAFAFPHHDEGVGEPFFDAVYSDALLDVSFGTAGLVSHFCPRHIERMRMEKTSASASEILARHCARACICA